MKFIRVFYSTYSITSHVKTAQIMANVNDDSRFYKYIKTSKLCQKIVMTLPLGSWVVRTCSGVRVNNILELNYVIWLLNNDSSFPLGSYIKMPPNRWYTYLVISVTWFEEDGGEVS